MMIEITTEKVLETIKKHPATKDVLESLFPQIKSPFKKGDWIIRKWHSSREIDIARVSNEFETDFFIRFNSDNEQIHLKHGIYKWKEEESGVNGDWSCRDEKFSNFQIMSDYQMGHYAHRIIKYMK